MMKKRIEKIITRAISSNQGKGIFPIFDIPKIIVEKPEIEGHGDYATNIAMRVAGIIKKNPLEIAKNIVGELEKIPTTKKTFEKIEIAGPGFIDFSLSKNYLQRQVNEVLKQKEKYGNLKLGKAKKVQVEFISANPTGPLTVGNARGGFFGDILANVLTRAGYKTERAYYINDYGMQVLTLGHSVLKDEEAEYRGDYIDYLNKKIKEKDPYRVGEKAAKIIIKEMIKKTVFKMGIKYDEWISETKLHQTGASDRALKKLKKKGLIYEKDGALWFKSSQFGDNRDRVVVKRDDWKTYLAGDIAVHRYKFEKKKFAKVINLWGADHYGDVPGLQAAVEALGHKGKLDIIILQFVTLLKGGKVFKMSKRLGTYVTMDELLKMVGLDVARYFFIERNADTHLNFDIDLARKRSEKNPVYYIQYAYARICSILKKLKNRPARLMRAGVRDLNLLAHPSELKLIKQLVRFPELVEEVSGNYQIQRIPQYALDLATVFHQFYRDCRVISKDENTSRARLALLLATKIVLKNTLDLMGISAPERM